MSEVVKPAPVNVFFYNFWNGFIEKTDGMDCTFFVTLFEKVFDAPIHITTSPDEATVLIESIFGDNTYLYYKKWRGTFLFTGESHYCNYPHISNFDCILGFEDTHDRYVKCPLYLLFLQTNPSIAEQLNTHDKNVAVNTTYTVLPIDITIPPTHASVVISNPHGKERLRFMDRLEQKMTLFYGGKHKNNVDGVVNGQFNSPEINDFYKRGKFAITMENANRPYYITEKLVNGFRSGVVPIYWGSDRVCEFFNPKRFLHLKPGATEEDISEMIERMCTMTDDEYLGMIRQPIMVRSMENVIDEISDSVKKILTLLTCNVVYVSSD
jgi:hypothetical protein